MSNLAKVTAMSLVRVWPAVDLTSAGSHEMLQLDVRASVQCHASINVKPEGGTPGICGTFDLYCLAHPQKFD